METCNLLYNVIYTIWYNLLYLQWSVGVELDVGLFSTTLSNHETFLYRDVLLQSPVLVSSRSKCGHSIPHFFHTFRT